MLKLNNLLVLYIYKNKINDEIQALLNKEFKKVFLSSSINQAKKSYKKYSPCIILLEDDFSSSESLAFLQELRQSDMKTAFVVLTNNTSNEYLQDLVELYISKYLVKPYTINDIYQALLKCCKIIENRIYSDVKLCEGIFFNFQTQSIIKNDKIINLNKKESILMNLFIQNPNRIITYEELEYHIWNDESTKAALKSLVRDFRKKTYKGILKNYSGIGYKLNIQE